MDNTGGANPPSRRHLPIRPEYDRPGSQSENITSFAWVAEILRRQAYATQVASGANTLAAHLEATRRSRGLSSTSFDLLSDQIALIGKLEPPGGWKDNFASTLNDLRRRVAGLSSAPETDRLARYIDTAESVLGTSVGVSFNEEKAPIGEHVLAYIQRSAELNEFIDGVILGGGSNPWREKIS